MCSHQRGRQYDNTQSHRERGVFREEKTKHEQVDMPMDVEEQMKAADGGIVDGKKKWDADNRIYRSSKKRMCQMKYALGGGKEEDEN